MNALVPMRIGNGLPGPGRPPEHNKDVCGEEIVQRLSQGEYLSVICRDSHMPSVWTVNEWQRNDAAFSKRIARARALGAESWIEEALTVASRPQDGRSVTYRSDGSVEMTRKDAVDARKLYVDTLFKAAAKICPAKYGEKVALVGGSEDDAPIRTVRKIERAFVEDPAPDPDLA